MLSLFYFLGMCEKQCPWDKIQYYLSERQTDVECHDGLLKLHITLRSDTWSIPQIIIQVGDLFARAIITASIGIQVFDKVFGIC
jgi:hypothetical protein